MNTEIIFIDGYSKSKYQEERFCDGNTFNKYKKYYEEGVDFQNDMCYIIYMLSESLTVTFHKS